MPVARRILVLSATAALSLGLVACSDNAENTGNAENSEAASSSTADSAFPRTIKTQDKDRQDTDLTIESQPKKIVSASVTLTGALLSLDAPVVASAGGNPDAPMFADGTGFGLAWDEVAQQKGIDSIYTIGSASAEAVLAQDPDLVVMSNVGNDSGAEIYDQLKDIVPVQVIDYSDQSWQDTTREVAEAAGLEDKADEVIGDYDAAVEKVKGNLDIEQPVNIVSPTKDGMNFFTEESAQGQIFSDLGIEVATPDQDLVGTSAQGSKRGDVKAVNTENLPLALDGKSTFVLNLGGKPADEKVRKDPQLADTESVRNNHVYPLDGEFFRIDAFSAKDLVDHLQEEFGK